MWKRGKRAPQDRAKKRSIAIGHANDDDLPAPSRPALEIGRDPSVSAPAPVVPRYSHRGGDYGRPFESRGTPDLNIAKTRATSVVRSQESTSTLQSTALRRAFTLGSFLSPHQSEDQRRIVSVDRMQSHSKLRALNRIASQAGSVQEGPRRDATEIQRSPFQLSLEPFPRFYGLGGAVLDVIRPHVASGNDAEYLAFDVKCIPAASDVRQGARPLDIAVVIDSSIYASPSCLMRCYDTLKLVMMHLDSSNDRLAMLRTNNTDRGAMEDYTILPLGGVDSRRIKAGFDSIQSSQETPDNDYLSRSVKAAQILLLLSLDKAEESEERLQPSKHVLVLTSNPSALGQDICGEDNIQVHVLCPQPTVNRGNRQVCNNGWFLVNRDFEAQFDRVQNTSGDFRRSIRSLISHARSGVTPSVLTSVSITINASKSCSLKGIIGATKFLQLHPGEVVSVLVKARAYKRSTSKSSLNEFPRGLRTLSGLVDLEKELECMLAESVDPTLNVKVEYTHPALPQGTNCQLVREVRVPAPASKPSQMTRNNRVFNCDAQIQSRQIQHIIAQKAPNNALAILRTHLGHDGSFGTRPDFLRTAMEELKYQARILERFDLTSEVGEFNPAASRVWGSTGNRSVATVSSASTIWRTPSRIPRPEGSVTPLASPVRPQPLRVVNHASSNETMDHARRIWMELRQKTKGNIRNTDDSPEQEERLKKIKQRAASNRRSVGMDTLKSMTRGPRKENVAPWL